MQLITDIAQRNSSQTYSAPGLMRPSSLPTLVIDWADIFKKQSSHPRVQPLRKG